MELRNLNDKTVWEIQGLISFYDASFDPKHLITVFYLFVAATEENRKSSWVFLNALTAEQWHGGQGGRGGTETKTQIKVGVKCQYLKTAYITVSIYGRDAVLHYSAKADISDSKYERKEENNIKGVGTV